MKRRLGLAFLAAALWFGAQATTALAAGTLTYEVLPGDTLSTIAVRFGVNVDAIAAVNDLGDPDLIVAGQRLVIPEGPGVFYRVLPGDSLSSISVNYGLGVGTILRANGLQDPDLIVIGTRLHLPGAGELVPAPARLGLAAEPRSEERTAHGVEGAPPGETESSEHGPRGRTFMAKITAYTYQTPVGGARGSVTRSGTPVRWGVLAVDPGVVPLGSHVRIDGFDHETFVAEDTGGAVRGNHVEIFYPDWASAIGFGVQTRRVTVFD